jgi:hypothetical protein
VTRRSPTEIAEVATIMEEAITAIGNGMIPSFACVGLLADPGTWTVAHYAMLFMLPMKWGKMLVDLLFGEGNGTAAYQRSKRINKDLLECEKHRKKQQYCPREAGDWKRMPAYPKIYRKRQGQSRNARAAAPLPHPLPSHPLPLLRTNLSMLQTSLILDATQPYPPPCPQLP